MLESFHYSIIPCGLQMKMATKITVIPISYRNSDTLNYYISSGSNRNISFALKIFDFERRWSARNDKLILKQGQIIAISYMINDRI